jgi:alanine-glyoxylate transaminase/serine-glyoxylate transaminase/serine-pyruvate transaminase
MVDAVSSLGIERLEMDDWGIDICISASQKGLESPPGLGVVAIGERGWDKIDGRKRPGWYLNLAVWKEYAEKWGDWHPYPVTQPTNNIKALRIGVERLLAEGLKQRFIRHHQATEYLRGGLQQLGLDLYIPDDIASNGVTSVLSGNVNIDELLKYMREKERILLAGSLGELKGKVFRVGHMGPEATQEAIDSVLFGLKNGLRNKTI